MNNCSQAPKSTLPVWQRLLQSLQNERCIDLRYRELNPTLAGDPGLPNYKIMKQVALRRRLGRLYSPTIKIARLLMPVYSVTQCGAALLASLVKSRTSTANGHVIATVPSNIPLIRRAIGGNSGFTGVTFDDDLLDLRTLAASLGMAGVLRSFLSYCRLLHQILLGRPEERSDLLLHSRDAFPLIMLCHYMDSHQEHWFATECHYQRWSFLLSHSAAKWVLVQHGFLDPDICLANACGPLPLLFGRDDCFFDQFGRFYRVGRYITFTPVERLEHNEFAATALFLASSFPSIDAEIALLRTIRAHVDVPVLVKFHPAHAYDDRKRELAELANLVCSATDYPDCSVFVSNNSFMEYDYQFLGKKTFAISRFDSVDSAAAAITNWISDARGSCGKQDTALAR
jgi:hypothetical protein